MSQQTPNPTPLSWLLGIVVIVMLLAIPCLMPVSPDQPPRSTPTIQPSTVLPTPAPTMTSYVEVRTPVPTVQAPATLATPATATSAPASPVPVETNTSNDVRPTPTAIFVPHPRAPAQIPDRRP